MLQRLLAWFRRRRAARSARPVDEAAVRGDADADAWEEGDRVVERHREGHKWFPV